MRPTQLVSVYLNEDNLTGGGSSPTPSTLTFENALIDASSETGGMFDITPTNCRMQAAGTITGKLGVFRLSGDLRAFNGGPGSVTWDAFLPPLAVAPSTFGYLLSAQRGNFWRLTADIIVALDGSVTLANATIVGAEGTYPNAFRFDFTISCQLA